MFGREPAASLLESAACARLSKVLGIETSHEQTIAKYKTEQRERRIDVNSQF